jgi:hypothetical protein
MTMTTRQQFVETLLVERYGPLERLLMERHGPVLPDPVSIPHIPPAAYHLNELLEVADVDERMQLLDRAIGDRRRHAQRRDVRWLSSTEAEAVR